MAQKLPRIVAKKKTTKPTTRPKVKNTLASRPSAKSNKQKLSFSSEKRNPSITKSRTLKKQKKTISKIHYDYLKGNYFRTIHVDGAIGSITSPGYIHMALFSEHPAIPQRITQKVKL